MSTTIAPTVSYVSSQDVNSMSSGTTTYLVYYPYDEVSGNIIMFEYKIQTIDSSNATLENTEFGFISSENAIQSGIANQWILAIPSEKTTYSGEAVDTISIRIYFGNTSESQQVTVTAWSDPSLSVYEPAATPIIFTSTNPVFNGSFYDNSLNELYVLLKEDQNEYDYENMRFIVCFFYENISGETVWKVSDQTQATDTTLGTDNFKLITVPLEGTVNETNTDVYVSVHAVYNWTYDSKNYYSLSYISNEVVAVATSNDSDPNITSVVYNVYDEVAVPGDQTMTVQWEAPGNSALPYFSVVNYNLYYSINDTSFVEYASNIPSDTLEYTVNVGSNEYYGQGLEMSCGDNIKFRVDAITVQGDTESSPVSDSTNFFKYSQAVTDLTITNSTWSGDEANFTVNFNGVSDSGTPNKGCGAGQQYVIKINGTQYVNYITDGSLNYVSDASYSITFSNLPVTQVGTVEVYLETEDTNSDTVYGGLSATVPYIASVLTLNDVSYNVYTTKLNESQTMVLSWNNPAQSGWTTINYIVRYSTYNDISGWSPFTGAGVVNQTTYNFNVTDFVPVTENPPTNIRFRIVASLEHTSGTVYLIPSNVKSQYTFKYATDVVEPTVNWALANTNETLMDVNVTFKNSGSVGVNNGLEFYRTIVLDSSNNEIASQDISYNSTTLIYTVNFDDISYSQTGSVAIQPFVKNPNDNDNLITSVNYEQDPGYTASSIPIFKNVDMSGNTMMKFEIISHGPLKPAGSLIVRPEDISLNDTGSFYVFDTRDDSQVQLEGITITEPTPGTNEENIYELTTDISHFVGGDENAVFRFLYHVADNAGVGSQLVQVERTGINDYKINYSFPPMVMPPQPMI